MIHHLFIELRKSYYLHGYTVHQQCWTLLLPTDAHYVKKHRVIKTYLHTVYDTHALQGKSDFIPLLSNLLFISL